MGWRFRKSIKVAPGVRLNLGKRGASVSGSVPGTGLSYSTSTPGRANSSCGCSGCLGFLVVGIGGILAGLLFLRLAGR